MLTPQQLNGRASPPVKSQAKWPVIMCLVGGYLVDLGPGKPMRWHTVQKDRTCSCGETKCFAVKAVEAYLKAGGQRTPEVTADDPPGHSPRQCPICQAHTIRSGSGWACTQASAHYWEFRTQQLRASRERWLNSLSPEARSVHAEISAAFASPEAREAFLAKHALTYPAES